MYSGTVAPHRSFVMVNLTISLINAPLIYLFVFFSTRSALVMGKTDKCQNKVLPARQSARKRKTVKTPTEDENTDLNGNIPLKNVKRTAKLQQNSGVDGNKDTSNQIHPETSKKRTNKTSQKCKKKMPCEDTRCDETVKDQNKTSSEYFWKADVESKEIHDIRTFAPEFDLDFFNTRACEIKIRPSCHAGWDSINFAHFFSNKQLGMRQPQKLQKASFSV